MSDNSKFFEKYVLNNNIEIPGRLVIPPLTLLSSNPDGTLSEGERKYLELRGTGVGLYILGASAVSQEGIAFICQPLSFSEKDINKISRNLSYQSNSSWRSFGKKEYSGLSQAAPSAEIANKELEKKGQLTEENKVKELTDAEIKKLIEDFANATEISLKAGYDGIEIHGANSYLIQQFYSPYTNRRTDVWGGPVEKRMNFPLKIVNC